MTPRFSNPHLLPQHFNVVSRAEIYPRDEDEIPLEDPVQLHRILEKTLPLLKHYRDGGPSQSGSRKRRRLEVQGGSEEPVLFRLVSSILPPLPVSLLPPPPPPSITREPDAEDTESQAALRKQRAEAASVDGATILTDAVLFKNARCPIIVSAVGTIPNPEPRLMVMEILQKPRKTRPPVPPSEVSYFPYVSAMHPARTISKAKVCPIASVEIATPDAPRRRRRTRVVKERRAPQFWRPDPSWKGPCQGYAYGYWRK